MNAIAGLTPIFAGCGGIAAADGPLPVGDVLALGVATIASLGAIGVAIYQASQTPSISTPKAEEKRYYHSSTASETGNIPSKSSYF